VARFPILGLRDCEHLGSEVHIFPSDGVKAARLLGLHCGVLKLTEEAHMQDKPLIISATFTVQLERCLMGLLGDF
jgi:hypothetical protein